MKFYQFLIYRHHTCKGWGLTTQKIDGVKRGEAQKYPCDCECHKEKGE